MWSDPNSAPQTGRVVADDLHALLAKSGERAPYVLVGHSLGGPYIMIYTKYYGPEVAGLVFVDASHPDQVNRVKPFTTQTLAKSLTMYRLGAALARVGLVRKMTAADSAPPEPAPAVRATAAYASTSLPAMIEEADAFDQTLAEAGTFTQLGNRPVFVLTATRPKPKAELAMMKMTESQGKGYAAAWVQMQNEIASWSSRSQHELVPNASHYIQFDQPGVVTKAIRSVVDSVRLAQ
jgi:pimeloyl-ACP methyl ester carboxylesterase